MGSTIGDNHKEVRYDLFCNTCQLNDQVNPDGSPVPLCDECQSEPVNFETYRPINYKEVIK